MVKEPSNFADIPPTKSSGSDDSNRNRRIVGMAMNGKMSGSSDTKINENPIMSNLKLIPLNGTKKEDDPVSKDQPASEKKPVQKPTKEEAVRNEAPTQTNNCENKQASVDASSQSESKKRQKEQPLTKAEEQPTRTMNKDSPMTSLTSEIGDFAKATRMMQSSIAELLEAPKTPTRDRFASESGIPRTLTPGSKFAALLKVDRQDSLKGFQIKLQSGGSQDNTPRNSIQPETTGLSLFGRQDSVQPQQLDVRNRSQSFNVLIPQKEDKNQIEREFIDKFHQTVTEKSYHVTLLS